MLSLNTMNRLTGDLGQKKKNNSKVSMVGSALLKQCRNSTDSDYPAKEEIIKVTRRPRGKMRIAHDILTTITEKYVVC